MKRFTAKNKFLSKLIVAFVAMLCIVMGAVSPASAMTGNRVGPVHNGFNYWCYFTDAWATDASSPTVAISQRYNCQGYDGTMAGKISPKLTMYVFDVENGHSTPIYVTQPRVGSNGGGLLVVAPCTYGHRIAVDWVAYEGNSTMDGFSVHLTCGLNGGSSGSW